MPAVCLTRSSFAATPQVVGAFAHLQFPASPASPLPAVGGPMALLALRHAARDSGSLAKVSNSVFFTPFMTGAVASTALLLPCPGVYRTIPYE
jgi:hypothetical protein